MMERIARLSAALLLATMAVTVLPTGVASAAEQIPTLQWGPLQRKVPSYSITGLDGSVTLPCDDGNPGSDLVTYDAAGNITRQLQRSQQVNGYTNCIRQPAVGADGDIYGYNKDTTNLLAYEGNTLKWSHWGGCYGGVKPVVVGANGVIYTINEDGGKRYLIGLTPEVDPTPGSTIPRVIVKAEIEGTCTSNHVLQPYNDGIVVFDQMNGPTWFSYAGKKLRKPAGMSGGVVATSRFNAQGELFFTAWVNNKSVIKKYSPDADMVLWSFELPTGNMVGLTPTSTGGVAATYTGPPIDSINAGDLPYVNQSYASQLLMLDANGAKLRNLYIRQPDNNGSIVNNAAMYADPFGGLAIVYNLVDDIEYNGVTTRYRKIAVQRMVYATGNVLYSEEIRGDYVGASPYGYESYAPPMFADDTVYITARCGSPNFTLCDPTPKILPLEVTGMGMDYPRGEVLASPPGGQPSPVNYVAMGDSFASGQGNAPYLPGTDGGNTCRRSYQAYARIMGMSPLTPLQLTDFVACGGAKTDHITGNWTNGNSNEGPQVDALSGDTEVVTVSIGGNDIGFADFAWECFTNCTQGAATAQWKIDNELPAKLATAYDAILDAAANADVYVVGYPPLLSELDNLCVNSKPFDTLGNRQLAIDLTNNLNHKIQTVVTSLNNPRLHFVPLVGEDSVFNGHSICSADPYFWGLDFTQANIFHPNGSGIVAQAMMISEFIF